jgi:hypothetical protein
MAPHPNPYYCGPLPPPPYIFFQSLETYEHGKAPTLKVMGLGWDSIEVQPLHFGNRSPSCDLPIVKAKVIAEGFDELKHA